MSAKFEIIVGTYEQFLLGYKIECEDSKYTLKRSFATHSHQASIRCVASKKYYIASAGADDSVYLYDMRYRLETGKLMHHVDTVNCVAFTPDGSHVFTCSNDGSMSAIRCGNWQVEKHWRMAHKGSCVNTLAIHPSGKIALSVGSDCVLRTWNLVKGRQAYATNLIPRLKHDAINIMVLKWSPDGEKYLLAANLRIDVYSVETAGITNEITFDSKVICAEFLTDNLIVIGHEDGKVRFYDLDKSLQILEETAHDVRVKCVAKEGSFIVTASSSGEIKLWRFTKKQLSFVASTSCGARITCLTLALPCEDLTVKEDEIKVEEDITNEEYSDFRIRQEVIIEDEGEVDEVKDPQVKKTKKRCKKKSREVEAVDETNGASLTQKKKKKIMR